MNGLAVTNAKYNMLAATSTKNIDRFTYRTKLFKELDRWNRNLILRQRAQQVHEIGNKLAKSVK